MFVSRVVNLEEVLSEFIILELQRVTFKNGEKNYPP